MIKYIIYILLCTYLFTSCNNLDIDNLSKKTKDELNNSLKFLDLSKKENINFILNKENKKTKDELNNSLKFLDLSKKENINFLLNKANLLYNNKKYDEAIKLYTYLHIDNIYILYKIALANFKNKNYNKAVLQFNNFFELYNNNKLVKSLAEKALLMSGYCYYLLSPDYYLDQKNTYNAIYLFKKFKNYYPNNKYINMVNTLLVKLNNKIEIKKFNLAKYYYDLSYYKSAIIFFKNFINDFPNSLLKEKAFFYMLKSQYKLYNYNQLEKLYNNFIEEFIKILSYENI
ncbi:MAG: outer membrane protein assembly factor BamD [Candidatus Bostrichicola ureolyticus]|nr:MAG: outer membrane protein assembly factor BamD [Candidatus Bostrichicola ureolyticus]